MSRVAVGIVVCMLVAVIGSVSAANAAPFYDDFASCEIGGPPSPLLWDVPTTQWGGDNINGGVNSKNVQCVHDATLGKTVLQFTAHGDTFQGTGPLGHLHDGSVRPNNMEWDGWDWQYYPTCAPYCNVRRVGGAVSTLETFYGGILEVVMKPCPQYGVASAIWLYNYTSQYCDSTPQQCSPAYAKQCCIDDTCSPTSDVCKGGWIANQEMDIEMPTSDSGNAARAFDPDFINFQNMRFSTYTALPSSHGAKCGVDSPCQQQNYEWAGPSPQNDGKYHTYKLEWFTSNSTATFYVDGAQRSQMSGANLIPELGRLWIAAWFPNAWTGSPDFDTCEMNISSVKFTPVE